VKFIAKQFQQHFRIGQIREFVAKKKAN
jgi:hypothetical protein